MSRFLTFSLLLDVFFQDWSFPVQVNFIVWYEWEKEAKHPEKEKKKKKEEPLGKRPREKADP